MILQIFMCSSLKIYYSKPREILDKIVDELAPSHKRIKILARDFEKAIAGLFKISVYLSIHLWI